MTTTTQLQPFTFTTGLTIRALNRESAPWFIATDIAQALGYRNASDMARMLDDDEKDTHNMRTLGGNQAVTIINESGLYSAILRSTKPEAKAFKKWFTGTVLPSIRKHGTYAKDAEHLPADVQANLYALCRGQVQDALRRHDKATEHDHWATGGQQVQRSQAASEQIAKDMGLPLAVVLAAASQGAQAGLDRMVKG